MRSILTKTIAEMFPNARVRACVEHELRRYGEQTYHRECGRVRLAILKLAGRDLDKVRECTDAACVDYRDVLAWAEFPEQMTLPPFQADAGVLKRDRQQYEAWLKSPR